MNDMIPYWTWAASLLALAVAYGAALATHELRMARQVRAARGVRRAANRDTREDMQRHVTRNP
jgi:hypothetical protein